ncbi:MAG: GDSL-type esterase/lipase family protein [Gemmataceae bacterium]
MFRTIHLLFAGAVVAAGLSTLAAREDEKKSDKPNPAAKASERLKQEFWKKRHDKFLNQTKKGGIEVAFLGDSITQGWEGNKGTWEKAFGTYRPGNYGIGGDQTGHVLWRITEGQELEGIDPKLAVIMIGTNNVPAKHSAEQIAGGIKAIVDTLREKKPKMKVLLLGVFPRAGGIGKEDMVAPKEKLNKTIPQINAIISKLDDGKMVFYKDIGPKFLTEDGGLAKGVMPDLLHLSKKGYEIWADAIKDDLEKLTK